MDSNLNEILKELKKLRQENIDLKNKNAQLERKELQYAQKFMRAKTSGTLEEPVNVPNGEKGIEDLIEKYNKKNDDLTTQLLSISDQLRQFTNDKKNFDNYKNEAEIYKKQYLDIKNKYDDIVDKYNRVIHDKNEKLCNCISERMTIINENMKDIKYEPSMSAEDASRRASLNQNIKNEIVYEIKEMLNMNNMNNNVFGYNTSSRTRSTSVINKSEPIVVKKASAKFEELIKPFSGRYLSNNITNVIEKFESDPFFDVTYQINIDEQNNKKIKMYYSDMLDMKTIKELSKQKLIYISIYNSLNNNSKCIIGNLIQKKCNCDNKFNKNCVNVNYNNNIAILSYQSTQYNESITKCLSSLSSISLLVIGLLSDYNIDLIESQIKTNDTVVIIHMLNLFTLKSDIDYYVENYMIPYFKSKDLKIKKSYMLSIKEIYETKSNKNLWYYSQTDGNRKIIHLIIAKESTEAGNFYNATTVQFLLKYIQEQKSSIIDIENSLKNYSIESQSESVTNSYSPEYSYQFINKKTFMINVDICDIIDGIEVTMTNNDNKEYDINIKGERVMKNKILNDAPESYSNRKSGRFELGLKIPYDLLEGFDVDGYKLYIEEGTLIIKINKI